MSRPVRGLEDRVREPGLVWVILSYCCDIQASVAERYLILLLTYMSFHMYVYVYIYIYMLRVCIIEVF